MEIAAFRDEEALQAHLETLGMPSATLAQSVDPTMKLGALPGGDGAMISSLHTLPDLNVAADGESAPAVDLTLLQTLGEGGMGVVHLARQEALDREVAVKTTRPKVGQEAAQSLLEEAYVTGYLEHPNIIPIYLVGRTTDGAPLIVMKRVEGRSWLELLEAEEGAGEPAELERHLEILIDVARAVWFAHRQGVIHRDIKPDNVMIGSYGEVYLVDWGLAVTDREDRPLLPRLAGREPFCGTPGYMAPEMAAQETEAIDTATDIYLLGATLHHVLTGGPRHRGGTLLQMMFAAHRSEPFDYGPQVPAELAQIANRACHRDRQQRYESAQAFEQALQDFLEHRESVRLGEAAQQKLGELQALLGGDSGAPRQIHDLYGECRFGFHQALARWPDNEAAATGLEACLGSMARYHLAQENLEAATACVDEMEAPPPALEAALEELASDLSTRRQDLARLVRLEKNLDLSTGRRARSMVMIVLGLVWTATSLYAALRADFGQVSPAQELHAHMMAGFRNLGVALVLLGIFRRPILANRVNRRMVLLFGSLLVVVAFLRWSSWHLGADVTFAQMADMVVYVLALMAVGALADLRICWLALPYALAAVASVIWPTGLLYFNTAAVALTLGGFAWLWWPRD